MDGLTLYQFTLSPFAIKVRRTLEYKSLPYSTVEVNPFNRRPVIRVSGQRLTPVLIDATAGASPVVIADSTRIVEHLERRFPDPPVYPPSEPDRARVVLLEDWSDERFARDLIPFKIYTPGNARKMVEQSTAYYPRKWYYELLYPFGPALLKCLGRRRRAGRSIERLRSDYEADLDRLASLAARSPFLAGEKPTVFDFAAYGLLRTMEGLAGEGLLASRPALAAWYERVKTL